MGVRLSGAAALFVLAAAAPLAAQQTLTTATVSGRVTDASGGAVRGARVTAHSLERHQQHETTSGADGQYRFLSLPVGSYEIAVHAEGFAPRTALVTLTVGEARDIPIALSMAGVTAVVDVSADAPLIEGRRTQVAHLVTTREIDELPLNGRNYLDLALLTPGVSRTVQRNTERFAETSAVPGTGISVSGQRSLHNTFIVDGLSANDDAAGLAGTYFAEEVIREFQVVTSGGVAEFGRASAGIINIITRSGANRRAARAYAFVRNDALDARNPLADTKDPLRQAQFGGTASGPIARNRTFWFANVERTGLERTGTITILPEHVEAVNAVLDGTGYPAPRIHRGEFPAGYGTSNAFGRIDHGAGGGRLASRYSVYDVRSANARTVGGLNAISRGTALANRDHTAAVSWLASRTSSLHELRAGATVSRLQAPPNDSVGPSVTISGVAAFGSSTTSPTARALDAYEVSDSYTVQRGAHLVKAGGTLLHERVRIDFPGPLNGLYTFASLAAFQAGRFVTYQQGFGEPAQAQTNPNLALFVQDEWRPRTDLTVNAGVRYDVQGLDGPIRTDVDNVSPRVGVALAPGGSAIVIRAAAGVHYDRLPLRALSNALQRDGLKYRTALLPFGHPAAPRFPSVVSAFPPRLTSSITSIDPGIENGSSRQGSVELERQIGRSWMASAAYVHLTGRGIVLSRNVNVPTLTAALAAALGDPNLGRPDPHVGNNMRFESIGRSRSDALTLSLVSRRARWGTLRTSYTLSRALDDAGNAFFSTPQDSFDVRADWGPSDNDARHRFTASGVFPPLAGIRTSYVFSYASAPPFNIQTGTDRNGDTNANDRPAGVGRNTARGFDAATLDVRITRELRAGRGRLELMVEAFNLLNRSNFLIPNNVFGPGAVPVPTFGRPTAAADPRQVQIGVRWSL